MSSIAYLPNVQPKNSNSSQIRRRVNGITATLNQQVGSLNNNSGDIGTLNNGLSAANDNISAIQKTLAPGISVTVALAKLTSGGTNGSLTVASGIITAYTPPT